MGRKVKIANKYPRMCVSSVPPQCLCPTPHRKQCEDNLKQKLDMSWNIWWRCPVCCGEPNGLRLLAVTHMGSGCLRGDLHGVQQVASYLQRSRANYTVDCHACAHYKHSDLDALSTCQLQKLFLLAHLEDWEFCVSKVIGSTPNYENPPRLRFSMRRQ